MVVARSQMASQSVPPDSEGPTHAGISGNQDSGSNHQEEDDEVIDLPVWDDETPEENSMTTWMKQQTSRLTCLTSTTCLTRMARNHKLQTLHYQLLVLK